MTDRFGTPRFGTVSSIRLANIATIVKRRLVVGSNPLLPVFYTSNLPRQFLQRMPHSQLVSH